EVQHCPQVDDPQHQMVQLRDPQHGHLSKRWTREFSLLPGRRQVPAAGFSLQALTSPVIQLTRPIGFA
ncbi:MAG TPA: hypothetical protein VKQ27_05650, partial [Acetobacteraceae bacterium]|nr:hypothetical protein [Acetobacteraceae bacterium]